MNTEQHTYEYWLGATEMKYSPSGVERTVRPSVTIKRARRVMEATPHVLRYYETTRA